jgi:SEC-C motif-containing protein
MTEPMPCPCGSGKPYSDCCEPLISGAQVAESPEALMRSRYTAFATQQVGYLEHSLHPSQRSDYDAPGTAKWAADSCWEGLEILNISGNPETDTTGKVEFRAQGRPKRPLPLWKWQEIQEMLRLATPPFSTAPRIAAAAAAL